MSGRKPRERKPRTLLRMPSAWIATTVLLGVAVLTVFGSTLAPQNPLTVNANALFQGPGAHHLLGTDYLGRDVLSRLMAGTRLSVLTALEAVGIGLLLGTIPGIATVFLGRWFDFAANRVTDALMTLPYIFFAVAVTAALGNGLVQAMVPVGILLAPFFFRITRAATLEHARAQYVEAAELMGASKLHVVRAHVLRKVLPTIAVTTASMTAAALLAVSFLTFLGIGVQPPAPTWGGVLSSAIPGIATVFLGRWFDFAANRVTDALMTLPYIFFAVAVTAALGNGLVQAMVPVGILLAPFFFRITRAATLEHARAQYVEAAELMGASKLHVVRAHVLRKVLPTIAVTTASMTAAALLAVSFLTFLGIGVQPPAPTWGGVLSSDLAYLAQAPWAPFIPGVLIAITVGALNALADAFRDRRTPGALAVPDPVIRTHSTLEPADDDRQSQVA